MQVDRGCITLGLGGQGVPDWGRLDRPGTPGFYYPVEEQSYQDLLGEDRAEGVKRELADRWAYISAEFAIYGVGPLAGLTQEVWQEAPASVRVRTKQEVKYHLAYGGWVDRLLSQVDPWGEHDQYLFMGTDLEGLPRDAQGQVLAPTDKWAVEYMKQTGVKPRAPSNHRFRVRDAGRALVADSALEWQWSYPVTRGELSAPLCVVVSAAMQEPKRWAWIMQEPARRLWEGTWDMVDSVVEIRAAYLRQLYRTAWLALTQYRAKLQSPPAIAQFDAQFPPGYSTPAAYTQHQPPASTPGDSTWHTPQSSAPLGSTFGGWGAVGLGRQGERVRGENAASSSSSTQQAPSRSSSAQRVAEGAARIARLQEQMLDLQQQFAMATMAMSSWDPSQNQ